MAVMKAIVAGGPTMEAMHRDRGGNGFCSRSMIVACLASAGAFSALLQMVPIPPAWAGPEQVLPLLFHRPKDLNPAIEQSKAEAVASLSLNIPDLLRSGKIGEADRQLNKLQADAEASIQAERQLVQALWVITDLNDEDLSPLYNQWIETYPMSFAPYLAYGVYHSSLAWKARGSGSGDKLSQAQITGMLHQFELAYGALERALALHPKVVVAYAYQIDAYTSICNRDKIEAIKNKALSLQPNDWWVRALYFHAMTPRWCGSLEKMQDFLTETLPYMPSNPNLAYLRGRVIFERAEEMTVMASRPDHERALPLYTEALTYGDYFSYRLGRAKTLMKLHRTPEAIADLEAAIRDRPTMAELHSKLAEARSKL